MIQPKKALHEEKRIAQAARDYADSIIATLCEPFVVLNKELRVETANRSFYQTFNVSPKETENQFIYDLGNGQWNIPKLRTLLKEVTSNNHPIHGYEVDHDFAIIGRKVMLLNAEKVYREYNHSDLILVSIEDITERRKAEAALEVSEIRYRRLFEAARDGILILDVTNGKITDANPFMSELLGYRYDEFIGKELWEIGLFKDVEASQAAFRELQAQGYLRYDHLPLETATGSRVEVEMVSNVYQENHDKVIQCNIRDITVRRQGEAALKVSEIRYRRLFETAKDGILILDVANGKITDANPFMSELLGYTYDEFIGKELWEIGLFKDIEASRGAFRELQELAYIRYDHLPLETTTGSQVEVEMVSNVYQENQDKVIQCNIRDITVRSRLEKHTVEQAQALGDLNRRKDEFIAMLSHELRNPLAPILSAVHLLRLQGDDNPVREQARAVIERQAGQLGRLIDDLMEVSRIITGRINLHHERLDARGVVERAVESCRPLIDQRKHKLWVSLAPEPIWLQADAARLEQVVVNLLNNAAKYMDKGGHIWLNIQQEGNEAVLRVRDKGAGIAADLLPLIFDLFTQADRTMDRSQGGLGIGLTVVQRLVEMHLGTVEASSPGFGEGSEFIVRLPVLLSPAGQQDSSAIVKDTKSAQIWRMLVVDDNADSADISALLLQALGHEVRVAYSGPTALDTAAEYQPDFVLLDIGLPGMDGYEVARRLRRHPQLGDVWLIAMTGYGQDSDRRRSQEAGIDHHLVKPVDPDKLADLLACLIAQGRPEKGASKSDLERCAETERIVTSG